MTYSVRNKLILKQRILKQAGQRRMPYKDDKGKPVSELLDIAFDALTAHEKKLDQLVTKLAAKESELSENVKKQNANLNDIMKSLKALEDSIRELEAILHG